MSKTDELTRKADQDPEPAGKKAKGPRRLARWKKALLALSVLLMVGGLALRGYAFVRQSGDGAGRTQQQPGATPRMPAPGFLPSPSPQVDGTGATSGALEESAEEWHPAVFRLGFSFFVGFCIAYALRTFFRISLVAIGLVLMVLIGLQYAGVVSIDWARMGSHYDAVARWLGEQTTSLRALVTGYLPSSASGVAGLVVGFRKG